MTFRRGTGPTGTGPTGTGPAGTGPAGTWPAVPPTVGHRGPYPAGPCSERPERPDRRPEPDRRPGAARWTLVRAPGRRFAGRGWPDGRRRFGRRDGAGPADLATRGGSFGRGRGAARAARRAAVVLAAAGLVVLPGTTSAQADGIRAQEWALDALHVHDAWHTTKGSGVTVAVLDTGVDGRHPDLTGRVLPGKDLIGFGAKRGDSYWARHGTAMAGIIAGHGHGSGGGDGVVGVAPKAKILPVRVILEDNDPARKRARDSRGDALAEGIRWAADHGADVINLSLGDDSASAHPEPREDAAVQYALDKGAVVVASAGNGGGKGDRISYPAAYPGVIAVTAVDRYGTPASFSTRSWYATLCAPGVDVVIADPDRRYYEGWGTSAAAAFVSGAAALVRAAAPKLSPLQVKQVLVATARDTPKGGRSDELGAGLVDPAAAVRAAGKLKPEPERPTAATYPHRYFGSGLARVRLGSGDTDHGGGGSDQWAVFVGLAGAALLMAAVALWRGHGPLRPPSWPPQWWRGQLRRNGTR